MKVKILNDRYAIVPKEKPRQGGMAEIWRAVDMFEDQKYVAIKMFSLEIETNKLYLEAYSRESKNLQRLDHPNIVKIFDCGVDDTDRRFLVLEWLEKSLTEYVAENPLAGWDSFYEEIGRPILEALTYSYGQDVLHRDLKPQNVLFSPDGVIKVADFGISKLTSLLAPACTVARFRSEPYAPPEQDFGSYTETRDVYGFAVLTLACLSEKPITTYEDVYQCLGDLDGPPEIIEILRSALSKEPKDRPENILSLKSDLESVQIPRESEFSQDLNLHCCKVLITRKVEEKLRRSLDQAGINIHKFVFDDLNEICGLKRYENTQEKQQQGDIRISIYSAQYLYAAVIDRDTKGFLVLTNIFPFAPSLLDYYRESSWVPKIRFERQIGHHVTAEGVNTITWLINGITEHEIEQAEKDISDRSERLFKAWRAILQAKSEIESRRETPIPYNGAMKNGNRITLYTDYPLEDDLVGQPRLIEVTENRVIAGEVDSIGDDFIVLWVESEVFDKIPSSGKLIFDTRASRKSINRQHKALDAVRFKRASRPDLCDLLVDPQRAITPSDPGVIEFVQENLDESKQEAVKKALGAESFLVVEGPPGTGKTLFITELVVQTLRYTPKARILLTSQTHVALDNALERIHRMNPNLKLVRIGRRHDERVSDKVKSLLLENRIDTWIDSVKKRSERFLKEYACKIGVDSNDLSLGMASERLRAALEDLEILQKRIEEIDKELFLLREKERERSAKDASETFHELKESLRETTEIETQIKAEIKRAQNRVKQARNNMAEIPDIGKDLSTASINELRDWEDAFLRYNEPTRRMHSLLQLAEEWYLRFGRSKDFFAALIADSELIAGTCLGFAGVPGIQNLDFDLCIVDEASKATITEILVPMSRSKKWVLVGDRNQLPPFVDDALGNKAILDTYDFSPDDLKTTLLEVLIQNLPSDCVSSLVYQHRMIRPIGDLISDCFYEGRLKSVKDGDPAELQPVFHRPVTWFSTSTLKNNEEQQDRKSYKNITEVGLIRKLLKRIDFLAKGRGARYSVAVLTGYASQKVELRRAIDEEHYEIENLDILCNTVDAFQGREADIAIYSITRNNKQGELGFLRERRRLNVALSRAKIGLAIVGDAAFTRSARGFNPWDKVLDYIESHPSDCILQEADK